MRRRVTAITDEQEARPADALLLDATAVLKRFVVELSASRYHEDLVDDARAVLQRAEPRLKIIRGETEEN